MGRFALHPDIQYAYLLKLADTEVAVTFNPQVFDEHPNTVRFLTYGSKLFESVIGEVAMPDQDDPVLVTRIEETDLIKKVAYRAQDGKQIETFEALLAVLEAKP